MQNALAILFAIMSLSVQAQVKKSCFTQTAASSSAHHSSLTVKQSIGQASVIGRGRNGAFTLSQGFLHPLTALGDKEEPRSLQATVFPNPFRSEVVVRLSQIPDNSFEISVFSLQGAILRKLQYAPTEIIRLDLSDMAAGFYLLVITTSANLESFKIQKL